MPLPPPPPPPIVYKAFLKTHAVELDEQVYYKLNYPWGVPGSTTSYPIYVDSRYQSKAAIDATSFSTKVKTGTTEMDVNSLKPSRIKDDIIITASADYTPKIDTQDGNPTLLMEHKFNFKIPVLPFDPRGNAAEITLDFVIAWDPSAKKPTQWNEVRPGSAVITIDVGGLLDQVVGKVSYAYFAGPYLKCLCKLTGVFREYGTFKVGVNWLVDRAVVDYADIMAYFINASIMVAIVRNSIQFSLADS